MPCGQQSKNYTTPLSAVARSLKVNHTKSIGLLATSSEAAYFAEIIEAVEKNCFQKGYT